MSSWPVMWPLVIGIFEGGARNPPIRMVSTKSKFVQAPKKYFLSGQSRISEKDISCNFPLPIKSF
jgi:hypothetical protein